MNKTLKSRLNAVIALITFFAIGVGVLGLYGMRKANDGLKSVYENRTITLEQISRIDRLLVQSELALAEAIQDSMAATIKIKSELIEKNISETDQTWNAYAASMLSSQERAG